jgi:hypothetical protein
MGRHFARFQRRLVPRSDLFGGTGQSLDGLRTMKRLVTAAASGSAWDRLIETRLASWLQNEAPEKEQKRLLSDDLSGMTEGPASLLGPDEAEEEWFYRGALSVGVGMRS